MNLSPHLCGGLLLLGMLTGCRDSASTSSKEKRYDVHGVGDAIYEQKQEIALSPEVALRMFTKEFPHVRSTWKDEVRHPIKMATNAWPMPAQVIPIADEKQRQPRAVVTQFSERQVIVMIQQPAGSYLWHHYTECLGAFRVKRTPQVDELLGLTNLVAQYAATYKGIGYGSSKQDVIKTLGEPDAAESTQAVGYFRYWYFKDDLTIQFQDGWVKYTQRGVPAAVKEEFKAGPKHRARF